MKAISLFVAAAWACTLTSGLAQPRLSLGITGGVQVYPNRDGIVPLLGASAWFKASRSFLLSGEYLRNKGVDLYPAPPAGFTTAPLHQNSRAQRFVLGLHYPVKIYNTPSISLLGINFGRSWDKRNYNLFALPVEPPFSHINRTDRIQRSVLFASLTALSQNKNFPFSLQARYGVSFSDFSSLAFEESKSFWQVLACIHWGIL